MATQQADTRVINGVVYRVERDERKKAYGASGQRASLVAFNGFKTHQVRIPCGRR